MIQADIQCPACKQAYCQPHFLPSVHECTAPLPPSMVDRIAPQCPMCEEIVSYPPGGRLDPNEAVEQHILSGTCTGVEGGEARKKALLRQRKDRGEVCYRKGCSKTLIVQMKCEACAHAFCPPHRHATAHSCAPTPEPSRSGTPAAKAAMSRFLQPSKTTPNPPSQPRPVKAQPAASLPNVQVEARAAAATAALKRAGQNVKTAGQDVKVPFVKTKDEKWVDFM